MEVRTIRKIILAAIALLVASEVIAWLYVVTNNITGIISGLVVFAVYAYCGKKAMASAVTTPWFMLPVILFTLVPVVIKFWPDGASADSSFIVSLALSDILITFTSLPVTAVTIFARVWLFPEALCNPLSIGIVQGN